MKTTACFIAALCFALATQAKVITRLVPYQHDGVKLERYLAYDDQRTSAEKRSWQHMRDFFAEIFAKQK